MVCFPTTMAAPCTYASAASQGNAAVQYETGESVWKSVPGLDPVLIKSLPSEPGLGALCPLGCSFVLKPGKELCLHSRWEPSSICSVDGP